MIHLIINNYYYLCPNYWNDGIPNIIKRAFKNKPFKYIKKNETKLIFSDGLRTVTLWNNYVSNVKGHKTYSCAITLQKNNEFRITKYSLTPNSFYAYIIVEPIQFYYLNSISCVISLNKLLYLIDFYNKPAVKKNLKRVIAIKKTFQDEYITRYISEFL
jgi:hypothetical protein